MPLDSVIIDSREPDWIQKLAFGGVLTVVTQLDHGDLLATTDDGEMIVVERKTADDLLNTIRADRFLPQMAGIAQQSRWAYLVITGSLLPGADGKVVTDRGATGWSWAAIQGALITAQELGVVVVQAGSDREFEKTVLRLGSRRHDKTMLVAPPKYAQELSIGEQIIASLPGIGLEKAQALIQHCGNAAQALAALTDMTVKQMPGIGSITKQRVRQALGVEPWAELAIVSTEGKLALLKEELSAFKEMQPTF
jgi:ERCC4-type nuclease